MIDKVKIECAGGTGVVTGANFRFFSPDKFSFLIDCGLEQGGGKVAQYSNWDPFPYEVKDQEILFITHAHLDHIGRIPKLIYDGFNGKILSTPATFDLVKIMLADTANILAGSESGRQFNLEKIYSEEVLKKVYSKWETIPYYKRTKIKEDVDVEFFDAGHVLGSMIIAFYVQGKDREYKIVFTGDLGNSPSPILKNTDDIAGADYMLMESVYGDRNHEGRNERRQKLKSVIQSSIDKKGVLLVPIFSLERTQEFLYELNDMVENGELPHVPIFLDSPLAIDLTRVFYKHKDLFKKSVREEFKQDDIFSFPGLKKTLHTGESKEIIHTHPPKIIIAGSGMSTGGRILHHEYTHLRDPKTTVLLTGYQTPGTLGSLIEKGASSVIIFGEEIPVKASIEYVRGYSGHKDSDHLVEFVADSADTLKKVFVAMGEFSSSLFLAQKISHTLGIKAHVPHQNEIISISLSEKK